MAWITRHRITLTFALTLLAAAASVVFVTRSWSFSDLAVYRWGGEHVLDGRTLYQDRDPVSGLAFTYPPFAALVFHALASVRLMTDLGFTIVSLVALLRAAQLSARHLKCAGWVGTLGLAGAMLLLEPGEQNLGLGQISFIILWLVLEGTIGPWRHWGGIALGIAAAIKLTPALFIVWLLVERRWRAASIGIGAFVAATGAAWAIVPKVSRDFWLDGGLDVLRVGSPEYVSNQSINGVLWRALGDGGSHVAWIGAGIVVLIATMWLAHRFAVAGDELAAVGFVALASVLIAPISWTHHWVLVVPLLAALARHARRDRASAALLVIAVLTLASRALWALPHGLGVEFDYGVAEQLVASSYVFVGVLLLVVGWRLRPRA